MRNAKQLKTQTTAAKPAMGRATKEPNITTYQGRFAARLRELREKRGKSVAEMVDAYRTQGLEVAASTIYGWENATRTPAIEQFPLIAAALGVSVRNLLPAE